MKRAAIYARSATVGHGIDEQVDMLTSFADDLGFEIVAIYRDDGVSGVLPNAAGRSALLKAASARKFEAVLVTSANRIARSPAILLDVLATLKKHDVRVVGAGRPEHSEV